VNVLLSLLPVVFILAKSVVVGRVPAAVTLLAQLQRSARTVADFRWLRGWSLARRHRRPIAELVATIATGIRVHNLGFTHPGTERPVPQGVELELPAGSTVSIVGENGAGKTTLVELLCRFYGPTTGTITLDGVDLRFEFSPARRSVSATCPRSNQRSQSPAPSNATAGSTCSIGSMKVSRHSSAKPPTAPGSPAASGRSSPSAGRLMRESPLLLVLDEPTSAPDAQSGHDLFERYAAGAKRVAADTGAITIPISHRFSTVRMADLTLVVSDGKLAEFGSHEQLMVANGFYAELYGLQAAQYLD